MKKIIFLDVDGTLVDFSQSMPKSTTKALIKAREEGHYLVLCTGRTNSTIYPWLREYFDGAVTSAGAHVTWNNKEIYHSYIAKEDLIKVREVLEKYKAGYLFQGNNGRYLDSVNSIRVMNFFTKMGRKDIVKEFSYEIMDSPYDRDDIESGIYHDAEVGIERIQEEVGSGVKITSASFGEEREFNGEFTKMGINKATGIKKVLEYLNIDRQDTIAFGDGPNDLEMIEFVEVGVAMGNADKALKEKAEIITDSIEQDGVYNGFIKLGLIKED